MGIKKHLFLLLLFCCSTISLANVERDSVSIDPRWNYWHVDAIAPNGDWAFLYKIYPDDRSKNKGFAVHIDTKNRVEITGISQPQFTATNFLIGKKETETVEVNLIDTKQQAFLGKLKQQDWIEEKQLLVYLTETNELIFRKYSEKGGEELSKRLRCSMYYINPEKTKLLYQVEGSTNLYLLDLKNLKETKVLDLKEPIATVHWNFKEDAIATVLKDNRILFIDLRIRKSKTIELPKPEASIIGLVISFFPNNDLYINYQIQNGIKDSTIDYLDIWNGNDRALENKRRPKPTGELKAFVYKQEANSLTELPRSKKQEYLNIGISDFLLVFQPLELKDYSKVDENVRYRLLQIDTGKELGDLTVTTNLEYRFNVAPNQRHIIYPKKDSWEIYNFETNERINIPHNDAFSKPVWSNDSRFIYYHNNENLLQYNISMKQTKQLSNLTGENRFSIVNTITKRNSTFINTIKPMIFSVSQSKNKIFYCSWFKGKLTNIVDETSNRLNTQYLYRGVSADGKTVVWTEENYNQPHTVKVFRKGKVSTLLAPELPEELYSWRKQKVIHYKDKYGVELTGLLWYPKDYDANRKYPMVTWIYERLGYLSSEFEIPTFYTQRGFNRALLTDEGYFVFMPDTYYDTEEGPGLSALECVTKGVENITLAEPAIDKAKIGLIGHSFGGYETSFILGNSKLFAAGVSGAGIHDLISFNYEYNYQLGRPNYFRVEGRQQYLKDSFGGNPTKYYNNSPIHFAQNFTAPVLLWTGMNDKNVHWEQTRHMYIALKRYKKPVIALFYKNQEHTVWDKNEQLDLSYRVLDWFNYYLKEKKEIEWINKGIDYTKY